MMSEDKFQYEISAMKGKMQRLRRRVEVLNNKRDILLEDIDATNKMVENLSGQVETLLQEANKVKGPVMQPGRLHQSDVLLTGQNIQSMMGSAETVALFNVEEQVEKTTTILKDAVVAQLSNNLAELLDALGFGKEHVQKHGMDETIQNATKHIRFLKTNEALLNSLRPFLK
ncbi:hypothetical protein PP756_gp32 [Pseudomonas phage VB_PaeP_VL1]|uniref:Uncharacterized protein n=1 Tax=Pseudomonas phage VB_PaeP_VL1 TaxID=2894395 RepID=A0AAE9CGI3_9CAUD|nr:hypothetical protein PP756_gp32 [Pseudomonas phage VB_PaeP_VL1]UGV19828.1 hypothetical protein vBPaePVL1_32 [Pseudomonas phage VB_PaeP_VL1]